MRRLLYHKLGMCKQFKFQTVHELYLGLSSVLRLIVTVHRYARESELLTRTILITCNITILFKENLILCIFNNLGYHFT
jgi:phosphate starvation-inducible membrane PsiE